jgi:monothiol glutaredoxin
VWANGELLGGGDIVSELNQNGELKRIISAAVKNAKSSKVKADVMPSKL